MDIDDLTPEQQELLKQIQARRKVVVREHRLKKGAANNQAIVPRRNDPRRISNTQTMKVCCSYKAYGSILPQGCRRLCGNPLIRSRLHSAGRWMCGLFMATEESPLR